MAANFSELLDANRLRPLWGTGSRAGTPSEAARVSETARVNETAPAESAPEDLEEGEALPEPQPPETPLQILDKADRMMRILLGPQAAMLQIYMHPLRKALGRLEGRPPPAHPLQSAWQTRNLPLLIYRLEDSFRAVLRTKERLGQKRR